MVVDISRLGELEYNRANLDLCHWIRTNLPGRFGKSKRHLLVKPASDHLDDKAGDEEHDAQ